MTARRIRVCTCMCCFHLFRWQRASPGAEFALQNCPRCCMVHDGDRIPSTLERPEDFPNLP